MRFFLHHENFKWSSITAAFRIQNLMIITNWQYILYLYVCTSFWLVFGKPFLHTTLDVHHRAHHVILNVHYAIYVVVRCKGNWGITSRVSMLLQDSHTSGFAFYDGQFSSHVQHTFLSQQYTIVSDALKCTVLMHWILPVKTYRL